MRVDEFLDAASAEGTEIDIAEWLGFCALDYHADMPVKVWALHEQNPETRLGVAFKNLQNRQLKLMERVRAAQMGVALDDDFTDKQPLTVDVPENREEQECTKSFANNRLAQITQQPRSLLTPTTSP